MSDLTMPATDRQNLFLSLRKALGSAGPLLALLLLVVIGTATSTSFLTSENLSNVLTRSAIIGIIAVGSTFVITAGGLDLSVGSLAALVAGVSIMAMNAAAARVGGGALLVLTGVCCALALGAAAGLLNGVMIVKGRVEA